jgi:hypothetical protein
MFASKKVESSTTNNRLRRAQQLRQKRHGNSTSSPKGAATAVASSGGTSKKYDDEESTLVVSGICTLLCGFVIVCIGAGMAALFFMIHQPDCVNGLSFDMTSAAKSFAPPDSVRGSVTTAVKTTPQSLRRLPESDSSGGNMSAQCTADQLAIVAQQLPAGGCERMKNKPWQRMSCSFSAASTCAQSTWFQEYFASIELKETFTAIIVGCNKGYNAVNVLQLGSKNQQNKYDWRRWKTLFLDTNEKVDDSSANCPAPPMPMFGNNAKEQEAQVFCLEPLQNTFDQLTKTKQAMGLTDNVLILDQVALANAPRTVAMDARGPVGFEGSGITNWKQACFNIAPGDPKCQEMPIDTFDHWIGKKEGLKNDAPIHYLDISTEGHDYEVLEGAANNLKRVHYLDLTYHWYGNWGKQSLRAMIERLHSTGFVCYWPGTENNLWRITDCWQDHYEHRFWAKIACVNTLQAPGLAQKMEDLFQKTLQKPNLQFGEA